MKFCSYFDFPLSFAFELQVFILICLCLGAPAKRNANICFPRLWLGLSLALLLLGCSSSVSVQNQGKRAEAKVHFVLICSLCLEAQAKRSQRIKKCNRGQEECEHLLLIFSYFDCWFSIEVLPWPLPTERAEHGP